MPHRTPVAALIAAAALIAVAGTAQAQTAESQDSPSLAAAAEASGAQTAQVLPAPPVKKSMRAPLLGALIGGTIGAGVSAAFSSTYAKNEGGKFCVYCMAMLAPITIGAGAGIGAGIGFAVRGGGSPSQHPGLDPNAPPPADRTAPAGWRQEAAVTIRF